MTELLRQYAANGFADFPGLRISGTVPIKQALLNDVLAEFLRATHDPPPAAVTIQPAPAFDANRLLRLVKKAEVRADTGVLTLEFELRVDDKPPLS